jgi:hypothetical protein
LSFKISSNYKWRLKVGNRQVVRRKKYLTRSACKKATGRGKRKRRKR